MNDFDDGAREAASQYQREPSVPRDRPIRPTARSVAPVIGELTREDRFELSMRLWRRAYDKYSDEVAAKRLRAPAIRQWLRAFGLASNDPDNIEEYAVEAGIPTETLREALSTENGAKIGIAAETQLRNSGELAHVAAARMMHKAVTAVARGLDDGSVSASAASKIIDDYGKYRERAAENSKASVALPTPFTGTAEQLIVEILDSNKPLREPKPFGM